MAENAGTVVEVEARKERGSAEAGRMRRQGKVPGVLYGGGKESVAIVLEEHTVDELLRHGGHRIFSVRIGGHDEPGQAMVKDVQTDAITGRALHVDVIRLERGHKVHVTVPIVLTGDCLGVREGGRLDFTSRELALEVLPREMVDKVEVDVSMLAVGKHVTVADLAGMLPPSGKFLEDPNRVVVVVERPRAAVVEEEVPAAAPAGPAEPELIKTKGKAEEAEG